MIKLTNESTNKQTKWARIYNDFFTELPLTIYICEGLAFSGSSGGALVGCALAAGSNELMNELMNELTKLRTKLRQSYHKGMNELTN